MPNTISIFVRPKLINNLSEEQLKQYQKALDNFINHKSNGLNLEKLQGGNHLYSIRVNKKTRLVLTPRPGQQQQHWLWVDTLDNHQYQQLKLKPNNWLRNSTDISLDEELSTNSLVPAEETIVGRIELHVEPGIEYQNQQFIVLDSQQLQTKKAPLPMVISGAPGSGKSSIALSLITQFIQQNWLPNSSIRILYLADSQPLVNYMRDVWQTIHDLECAEFNNLDIQFKTPHQLYEEHLDSNTSAPKIVADMACKIWFDEYVTHHKRINHTLKNSDAFPDELNKCNVSFELVYQEFRAISGYDSFERYNKAVGSTFSLFVTRAARQWLWNAFNQYCVVLNAQNQIDLTFQPLSLPSHLDFLVCDEAADLSGVQLRSIPEQIKNYQVTFCVGDHQRLRGSESVVPFIRHCFWRLTEAQVKVHHEVLQASYRCASQVILLANAALQLKFKANGSSLNRDHSELPYISAAPDSVSGEIFWLHTEQELRPLINDKENAHFAVITSLEFKHEAQQKFGHERVFTPEEIKGLQYKDILIYRLLESNGFKAANHMVGDQCILYANPAEFKLPKTEQGTIIHNQTFNELFIAISRAQHSVSVYQPAQPNIRYIRQALLEFIATHNKSAIHSQAIPTHSSPEEWQQLAERLKTHHNTEQVNAISQKCLEQSPSRPLTAPLKENTPPIKTYGIKKMPKKTNPQKHISLPSNEAPKASSSTSVQEKKEPSISNYYQQLYILLSTNDLVRSHLTSTTLTDKKQYQQHSLSFLEWLIIQGLKYHDFLYNILLKNPDLAKNISSKNIYITPFHIDGQLNILCFCLNNTANGRAIIALLAAQNPNLVDATYWQKFKEELGLKQFTLNPSISFTQDISPMIELLSKNITIYDAFPEVNDLVIPKLVHYSLQFIPKTIPEACQLYEKDKTLTPKQAFTKLFQTPYLFTVMDSMPIANLSEGLFFQPFLSFKDKERYCLYLELPHPINVINTPISLKQLVNTKRINQPSLAQLLTLAIELSIHIDNMPLSLVMYPTLETIFITNPQCLGTQSPLIFRLCPSTLVNSSNLAPYLSRNVVLSRMLAMLFLTLGTEISSINDPDLLLKIKKTIHESPAFISVFTELWNYSFSSDVLDTPIKVFTISPTLNALKKFASNGLSWKKSDPLNAPALITSLAAHDTRMQWTAAYELIFSSTCDIKKKDMALVDKYLQTRITVLIPCTLVNPLNSPKISLWNLQISHIIRILAFHASSTDYEQLNQLQQDLLQAGLVEHLELMLCYYQSKQLNQPLFNAVVCAIWMSFSFDTIRLRLFSADNTRKMASILLRSAEQTHCSSTELSQYLMMLLHMSDFAFWLNPKQNAIDRKVQHHWNTANSEVFLDFGIRSCPIALSNQTTKIIIQRLEQITAHLLKRDKLTTIEKDQLNTCLNYLCHYAWNGQVQTANSSFDSQQHARATAKIFKAIRHPSIIKQHANTSTLITPSYSLLETIELLQKDLEQQQNHYTRSIQEFYSDDSEEQQTHKCTVTNHQPDTYHSEAPLDINSFHLVLPPNAGIQYYKKNNSSKLNVIYSIIREQDPQEDTFIPSTLTSNERICIIPEQEELVPAGTQGLYRIDIKRAGERQNLLIGLMWDKTQNDQHSVPGNTKTSIALDAATGHIHYIDSQTQQQISIPYTARCHSHQSILVGINGRQVYFVINGFFYPPVPHFLLPLGADIYTAIRIGCRGVLIETSVMGALIPGEQNADNTLIQPASNPLANILYVRARIAKLCYHFAAQNQRSELQPQLQVLVKEPELIVKLSEDTQIKLLLILLAGKQCHDGCSASMVLKTMMGLNHSTQKLKPLEFALATGQNEFAVVLAQKNSQGTEPNSTSPLTQHSLFAPKANDSAHAKPKQYQP